MIDTILEKLNLRYEDLNIAEKETLNTWIQQLSTNKLILEDVKKHISFMRGSVERELTTTDLNTKQDLFLKARLRNYMLLEALMNSPDEAKQSLEKALSGLIAKK